MRKNSKYYNNGVVNKMIADGDPIPEGFRNICKNDPSWWEFEEEGKCGEIAHYTFRFTDSDYEFAASQQ